MNGISLAQLRERLVQLEKAKAEAQATFNHINGQAFEVKSMIDWVEGQKVSAPNSVLNEAQKIAADIIASKSPKISVLQSAPKNPQTLNNTAMSNPSLAGVTVHGEKT